MNEPRHVRWSRMLSGVRIEPVTPVTGKFVDRFDSDQLFEELALFGVINTLEGRGYAGLDSVIDVDANQSRLRLWLSGGERRVSKSLVLDLALWRERVALEGSCIPVSLHGEGAEVITIEWMMLQDQLAPFARPSLPGQMAPSLGVGRALMSLLANWSRRLDAGGVTALPDHFHTAVLYRREGPRFIDPEIEGLYRAVVRDLLGASSLAEISWAFDWELVKVTRDGVDLGPWSWPSELMIVPTGPPFTALFESDEWSAAVAASEASYQFAFHPEFWRRWPRVTTG